MWVYLLFIFLLLFFFVVNIISVMKSKLEKELNCINGNCIGKKKREFSHCLLTPMLFESQMKLRNTQNISGAPQWNRIAALLYGLQNFPRLSIGIGGSSGGR